jgi:hypothetical protein
MCQIIKTADNLVKQNQRFRFPKGIPDQETLIEGLEDSSLIGLDLNLSPELPWMGLRLLGIMDGSVPNVHRDQTTDSDQIIDLEADNHPTVDRVPGYPRDLSRDLNPI